MSAHFVSSAEKQWPARMHTKRPTRVIAATGLPPWQLLRGLDGPHHAMRLQPLGKPATGGARPLERTCVAVCCIQVRQAFGANPVNARMLRLICGRSENPAS